MAKILFLMRPEKGHLNSSLKIAKTLKSRGHRIVYLQLFEFEEYVRQEGFEFAPLFGEFFPRGRSIPRDYSISLFAQVRRFFDQLAARRHRAPQDFLKEELNKVLEMVQPELLIMDSYLAIPMMPAMPRNKPPCVLLNSTIVDPYTETAFSFVSGMPTLFLCPQEFDLPNQHRLPEYHYVEASCDLNRKETVEFPWERIEEGKKLVYCALGSQSHWSHEGANLAEKLRNIQKFLQAVINAFSDRTDCQLVMAMGMHLRAEDFHSVPVNAVLVNETPQMAVLKKADLAITHGGLNSVKECIFFGVPMIVFPVTKEQSANAARVIYNKIGVAACINTASEETIRSLLGKIESDPGFKDRAAAMMETFHKAEREQRAVTLIEECLAGQVSEAQIADRRMLAGRRPHWFSRQPETTASPERPQPQTRFVPGKAALTRKVGA